MTIRDRGMSVGGNLCHRNVFLLALQFQFAITHLTFRKESRHES
jgi:hypothetical protein